MTAVTNRMIDHLACKILDDLEDIREGFSEFASDLHTTRGVCIAIQQDFHGIYGLLARQERHLDRLEERLGLSV